MIENKYERDLLAQKVLRILLCIQLGALVVGGILAFTRIAFLGLLIALVTLFILLVVFVWLFLRFNSFPIVKEKRKIQTEVNRLQTLIQNENRKIQDHHIKRDTLHKSEREEIINELSKLQKNFIKNGLVNHKISDAKIPGIGPKMKERLYAHRVMNAADVTVNITSIDGLGQSKCQAIFDWQCETR